MKARKFLLLLVFVILIWPYGCKTRKVSLDKTTRNEKIDSSHTNIISSLRIDSSAKHTKVRTFITDSNRTQVEIRTDPGVISTVRINQDGTIDYTGKITGLKYQLKKNHNDRSGTDTDEKAAKSQQIKSVDKTKFKKQVDTTNKHKDTTSSIDWGKTIGLISIVFFIVIAAVLAMLHFNVFSWFGRIFSRIKTEITNGRNK